MKKFAIFESSIIGLFVGVIVSTYLAFLNSSEMFVGRIISYISLIPILDSLNISANNSLIISFVFVVVVYVVYGVVIGLIIQKIDKAKFVIPMVIALLLVGGFFEQRNGMANQPKVSGGSDYLTAAVVNTVPRSVPKTPEQYFGNESIGDLNGDGKDDVAFVTLRDDKERGILYYLIASIRIDRGYAGSNIVFLGDRVEPKSMIIENGVIDISYIDGSKKNSTNIQHFYAQIIDGVLKKVDRVEPKEQNLSTTTPDR